MPRSLQWCWKGLSLTSSTCCPQNLPFQKCSSPGDAAAIFFPLLVPLNLSSIFHGASIFFQAWTSTRLSVRSLFTRLHLSQVFPLFFCPCYSNQCSYFRQEGVLASLPFCCKFILLNHGMVVFMYFWYFLVLIANLSYIGCWVRINVENPTTATSCACAIAFLLGNTHPGFEHLQQLHPVNQFFWTIQPIHHMITPFPFLEVATSYSCGAFNEHRTASLLC